MSNTNMSNTNMSNTNDNLNEEEILKFSPWNENNKLIDKSKVLKILKQFEIEEPINDLDLYQRAFVHKSYINKKVKINSIR